MAIAVALMIFLRVKCQQLFKNAMKLYIQKSLNKYWVNTK